MMNDEQEAEATSDDTAGTQEPGEVLDPAASADGEQVPRAELDKVKDDLSKAKDALLRTAADFDNFRKRQRREMEDNKKFATEKVLLELLPVLDNLQRALGAAKDAPADAAGIVQGVKMVADQFRSVMESQGLKGFDSVGQVFDPMKHEAVSERDAEEVPAGHVVEEFQRGYMLHDRVVRPAMVVVSKGAATAAGEKAN